MWVNSKTGTRDPTPHFYSVACGLICGLHSSSLLTSNMYSIRTLVHPLLFLTFSTFIWVNSHFTVGNPIGTSPYSYPSSLCLYEGKFLCYCIHDMYLYSCGRIKIIIVMILFGACQFQHALGELVVTLLKMLMSTRNRVISRAIRPKHGPFQIIIFIICL